MKTAWKMQQIFWGKVSQGVHPSVPGWLWRLAHQEEAGVLRAEGLFSNGSSASTGTKDRIPFALTAQGCLVSDWAEGNEGWKGPQEVMQCPPQTKACQSLSDMCLSLPLPVLEIPEPPCLGDLCQPLLSSQPGMEPSAVMAEQRDPLHGVTPCHFIISSCNICPLEQSPGIRTSQGCLSSPSCVKSLWLAFCHKVPLCLVPLPSFFRGFKEERNAGRKRDMQWWIPG